MKFFYDHRLNIYRGKIIAVNKIVISILFLLLSVTLNIYAQRPAGAVKLEKEIFSVEGNQAFVIMPGEVDNNYPVPWVWFAPTIGICPTENDTWMFKQFLENGIAVAGIDVGESYGSPAGTAIYSGFYDILIKDRNFAKKPCLLARSCGGLMLYNWAVENPASVACVAGIFPVCDLRSYPGLKIAATAYKIPIAQLDRMLADYNPVDRIEILAKAGIPVYHMHGDIDYVVPLNENSLELKKRYDGFGGDMILEVVKGQGHNYWPGWYTNQKFVDFIIENASGTEKEKSKPLNTIKLTGLRCEGHKKPLGIDVEKPRLSWKMLSSGDARGVRQTAYQVIVKDASAVNKEELLWDSGKTESSKSNGILYKGPRLQLHHQYLWKVRVWDENDLASGWSAENIWGMGIIDQDEWKGQWIKSDLELYDYQKELKKMPEHARQHARNVWKRTDDIREMTREAEDAPAVWLRKEFRMQKRLQRATGFI